MLASLEPKIKLERVVENCQLQAASHESSDKEKKKLALLSEAGPLISRL